MKLSLNQRVRVAIRRVLAWRWAKTAGRAAAVLIALVVLAVIGRATAGAASTAARDSADSGASAQPSIEEAPGPAGAEPVVSAASSASVAGEGSPVPLASAARPEPSSDDDMSERPPPSGAHRRPATADDPVYLNDATVADLQRLPSVGQKRAAAILALRQRLGGRFQQIDQIMKVRGMGAKAMKRLRPLLRLDRGDAGTPAAH